jgi:hypothetical protein
MAHSRPLLCRSVSIVATALPPFLALGGCGDSDHTSALEDPAMFREMTLAQKATFGPPKPPGALCDLDAPQTTIVIASPPSMSWDHCTLSPDFLSVTMHKGSRGLTPAELASSERCRGSPPPTRGAAG